MKKDALFKTVKTARADCYVQEYKELWKAVVGEEVEYEKGAIKFERLMWHCSC